MPDNDLIIRRYKPGEEPELWRLYHDTTHIINGRDYTPGQCERWAPGQVDMEKWKERLLSRNPFVAERQGVILGFAELMQDGTIDYFYCHHEHQREGIGRALYAAIESEARRLGLASLHAAVSVTAKPFFLSMGFIVEIEQNNVVCGVIAPNSLMKKIITS